MLAISNVIDFELCCLLSINPLTIVIGAIGFTTSSLLFNSYLKMASLELAYKLFPFTKIPVPPYLAQPFILSATPSLLASSNLTIELPSLFGLFNFAKITPDFVMAICLAPPILLAYKLALKPSGNFKPAFSCAKTGSEKAKKATLKN